MPKLAMLIADFQERHISIQSLQLVRNMSSYWNNLISKRNTMLHGAKFLSIFSFYIHEFGYKMSLL